MVQGLLEDLVDRGLDQQRRYLVVIDGSRALRAGVERIFGEQVEMQRCQIHKRRNMKEYLPENCQKDYDSADAQCVCDEQLHGGQRGAAENLPATGANQSERGPEPGGRSGRR